MDHVDKVISNGGACRPGVIDMILMTRDANAWQHRPYLVIALEKELRLALTAMRFPEGGTGERLQQESLHGLKSYQRQDDRLASPGHIQDRMRLLIHTAQALETLWHTQSDCVMPETSSAMPRAGQPGPRPQA